MPWVLRWVKRDILQGGSVSGASAGQEGFSGVESAIDFVCIG